MDNVSQKQTEHFFDARHLICPMPVLRARKILLSMAEGEILKIHVTDKSAPQDFREFCQEQGYRFLGEEKISDTVTGLTVGVGSTTDDPL